MMIDGAVLHWAPQLYSGSEATVRGQGPAALVRVRLDTLVGTGISNLVALAIMATSAATLHVHGMTEITSGAQATEALQSLLRL